MPEDPAPTDVWPGFRMFRLRGLHVAVITAIVASALTQAARGWYPLLNGISHPRILVGDSAYMTLTWASQVVLYAAGVLFVIWLWRARKNLDAFANSTATLGAGWAIGGWFVPVANLFIPYHMLAQVARSSSTSKTITWLVHGWWVGYFGQVLGFVSLMMTDNWIPATAVTAVLWMIAGCFLAAIVAAVTRGQHSRMDAVHNEVSGLA